MIILYWCPACRAIHGSGDVVPPTDAGAPWRCDACKGPVDLRALRDDPDDERYGTPRCTLCQLELATAATVCPACGTPCAPSAPPAGPATVGG